MNYKVVIFDLDGTLLDTLEDLAAAVNHALSLKGFPPHTLAEYRLMVGHGVRNLVTQALPEEQRVDAVIDTCLAEFKAYYTAHIDTHTHPYPGMQELLRTLHARGVRLAVASNKFQSGTEYLIRRFFGDIPFVAILGNREGYPLKPDPEIVGEVLRRARTDVADAVLVGDSATDMTTAANGGISAIAVTWGYRDLPEAVAPIRATTAAELATLIL
jgi:phosphoglycolate phosphatase